MCVKQSTYVYPSSLPSAFTFPWMSSLPAWRSAAVVPVWSRCVAVLVASCGSCQCWWIFHTFVFLLSVVHILILSGARVLLQRDRSPAAQFNHLYSYSVACLSTGVVYWSPWRFCTTHLCGVSFFSLRCRVTSDTSTLFLTLNLEIRSQRPPTLFFLRIVYIWSFMYP